jgi:phenylpropionate dioxygenase-like ring-hydroxylating dioxygenase large terminal subunit
MPFSIQWHPVAPSVAVRAGDNVLATMAAGRPLALWRSASGQVQAWEDRCPHRGVALSLGRVQGDRLACAYHGWEYAAGSGRCVAIPALPDLPVPGKVCAKSFTALERQGMVWVRVDGDQPANDTPPPDDIAPLAFLRTIGVNAGRAATENALEAKGYRQSAPCRWHGELVGVPACLFALFASSQLCLLHLTCAATPGQADPTALFAAARMLRQAIESDMA